MSQPIDVNGPALLLLAGSLERHQSSLGTSAAWSADNCGSSAAAGVIRLAGSEARNALTEFGTEFAELGRDIRLAARDYEWQDATTAQAFAARSGTAAW